MGSTDWTEFDDDLDLASLDRGVTTAIARPNGGGAFVYGFNSRTVADGGAALFSNQVNFAPTPPNKGGSIRAAIQRGISAGETGFSPFLIMLAQGQSLNDSAYLLGLQDDAPYRIALRKGRILDGILSGNPGGAEGILRRSTATYGNGVWLHTRLDAVVNLNGDVILKAFQNDLNANPVTAPVWTPIPGIEDSDLVASHGAGTAFVDDALSMNGGSFTSGRMGFGISVTDVSRRGFFDHIEVIRQL